MKANIIFDENNYIIELTIDEDGEYELPEDFDFMWLNCYKLVDGEIVFDDKKDEYVQSEIFELEEQLKQTDEDMLDFLERLFSFKNPLTFLSDMINLMKDYATLVATRQDIREQIRRLK